MPLESISQVIAWFLKIFDHLDWSDEHDHLLKLQDKINTYLEYMEGEEIYEAYADAKDREFVLSVDFQHRPPASAINFMEQVGKICEEAGFGVEYSILDVRKKD